MKEIKWYGFLWFQATALSDLKVFSGPSFIPSYRNTLFYRHFVGFRRICLAGQDMPIRLREISEEQARIYYGWELDICFEILLSQIRQFQTHNTTLMSLSHLGSVTTTHRLKLSPGNGVYNVCKITGKVKVGLQDHKPAPYISWVVWAEGPEGYNVNLIKNTVNTDVKSKGINVESDQTVISHFGLYRQDQVQRWSSCVCGSCILFVLWQSCNGE